MKNKFIFSLFAVLILVGGCKSVVFPDVDDSDEIAASEDADGNGKGKMISEGNSLGSDSVNVAYEGEKEVITPAKTIPVTKESQEGYHDVTVKTNDKKLNELLNDDKPTVAKATIEENTSTANYVPSVSYLAETIYFDNGSGSVGGSESAKINKIARLAKQHNAKVVVYGYASSRTRNTDITNHKLANFNVSAKRAEDVAKALRKKGVKAANISTEAMSDNNPAYLEVMPEGERLNRRAEVYISY